MAGRDLRTLHAGAALGALLGGASLFGLLLALNAPLPDRADAEHRDAVAFEVAPPPPPPPRQVKRRRPRRKESSDAPPVPVLAASLTGLDLGLDPGGLDLLGEIGGGLLADAGDVVMTEDAVDSPPRPLETVAPRWPARARSRGVTGRVLLRVLVSAAGQALDVRVESAAPAGVFEDAAVDAVRQWTFEPARYHGAAVKTWARLPVRFGFEGGP